MGTANTRQGWDAAVQLAEKCRKDGGLVVTANGCFDCLHKGHVSYLAAARQLGDCLIVGVNSDASVKKLKGPGRPLNDQDSRSAVLAALRSVDAVLVFDEETPLAWLELVRPNIHVKGGDYDPNSMIETPVLKKWGGKTVVVPFVEGYSTTQMIARSKGSK